MSDHAFLAPSSAPIWGRCSGSAAASIGREGYDTEESRRGTAAHWVCAECLTVWQAQDGGVAFCADWVGKVAPNGYVIDRETAEGAQVFVDDVLQVAQRVGGLQLLKIELRVEMPEIHPACWGTLDCALYVPSRRAMWLWDYKNGHRETVARDNLQLISYAKGLVNHHQIDGYVEQQTTLSMRIVQPFCYRKPSPVDEWRVTLSDLRAHWNQLSAQAHEATGAATLSTGEHCRDCRAVMVCPAARKAVYSLVDYLRQPYGLDMMRGEDLAAEWHILESARRLVEARRAALEDEIKHQIGIGAPVPGLALEASAGREVWAVPDAVAVAVGGQFGADVRSSSALTPRQARQAVPAAVRPLFDNVIKTMTARKAGSLKIINAADSVCARAFKPTTEQ